MIGQVMAAANITWWAFQIRVHLQPRKGGHSWRWDSTCISIGLPEPSWRERCKQGVPWIELKAFSNHSSWFSFGRGALLDVRHCSWAACQEPHEIQQIKQRCLKNCLLRGKKKVKHSKRLRRQNWGRGTIPM
ncbi:uncharacterized protein LOC114280342 [Camellia sinensis]|uniref:uncharacterized protein LOC114280342 n=1 Tax=Camellia sinensis TaxID=4442 RepID=UPI0010364979|nr:uncharacterized protein LOC114280342 [Camellia sinensis]